MKLIDYEGNVAATIGWAKNWSKPIDECTMWISDIPAQDYVRCLNREIQDIRGDVGVVWPIGATRPVRVDMTNWKRTIISRPVKKPRIGKKQGCRYDWEWVRGKWQRIWLD